MIVVYSNDQIILEVKKRIQQSIENPFIWTYLDKPLIDEDKIAIFVSLFNRMNIDQKACVAFTVPAMLMQIALDTHEKVSISTTDEDPNDLRKRQLAILAGDFYSSLYYHLLAKTENIAYIRVFSQAIKEVNEAKILLYMKDGSSINEYVDHLRRIETSLYRKTAEFCHAEDQIELIEAFLLYKRLYAESIRTEKQQSSKFLHAVTSFAREAAVGDKDMRVQSLCRQQLQIAKEKLEKLNIGETMDQDLSQRIVEWLQKPGHKQITCVEEG